MLAFLVTYNSSVTAVYTEVISNIQWQLHISQLSNVLYNKDKKQYLHYASIFSPVSKLSCICC